MFNVLVSNRLTTLVHHAFDQRLRGIVDNEMFQHFPSVCDYTRR